MAKLKKTVTFALLGLGTVGAGVAELLEKNRQLIEGRVGASLVLKAALVRDVKKAPQPACPSSVILTTGPGCHPARPRHRHRGRGDGRL